MSGNMRRRRQRLGQHFLRDQRIAAAIAATLPDPPGAVLEIGPGRGALTRPLLERFGRVRAVELDRELARALAGRLGRPAGLEVVEADALEADLDSLCAGGPWLVAGNLPYSVGTAILRRLLPRHDLFSTLVLMLQHEVVQRLVAGPGARERGLLSVEVEAYALAKLLFTVPARCFLPPPRVLSAVVRLDLHRLPAPPAQVSRALELAGVAFTHRRKKLANALAAAVPPAETSSHLFAFGLVPGVRPEDLALDHWLELASTLPQ
ncbi:MAG: 16S rRNA (adenine(1518)-N(6)/adenine(1519)-N(6))-dimethyltransferase RsmA [Acidobacteriota bacterium]